MLFPGDLPTVPEDLARQIIAHAVSVAPCLDNLPERGESARLDELRERALSILSQIAKFAFKRGDSLVKGQRVGPAAVDYGDVGSYFSAADMSALRAICNSLNGGASFAGVPVGSFPPSGIVSRVWPEVE